MRRYYFMCSFLLAAAVLTGCGNGDDFLEEVKGNIQADSPANNSQVNKQEPEDPNVPDDDVSLNLPEAQCIDAATFYAAVVGKGWQQTECHLINRDGKTYLERNYNEGMVGSGFIYHLAFTGDTFTSFYTTNIYGILHCYTNRSWQYDGQTNILTTSDGQQIKVLSVSPTEMQVIFIDMAKTDDYETGELIDCSFYHVYRLMTDSELLETRGKYWVNGDDLQRPMTPKDLQHKWVLTNYTDDQHVMQFVGDNRSDEQNYIRFADNGTFEGKAKGKEFSGKYEYDGRKITLTSNTTIGNVGNNYFLKKVWEVKDAKVTAGAHLSMNIASENSFYFVRGIE